MLEFSSTVLHAPSLYLTVSVPETQQLLQTQQQLPLTLDQAAVH